MTGTDVPIACTLTAGDYQQRMAWLAELNDRGLTSHRTDDLTLHLRYGAAVLDDVQELVRRESACCGFLMFDLKRSGDHVDLAITAPPEAELAAKALFDAFISGARLACASTCACS
jgi:hypothetical protein